MTEKEKKSAQLAIVTGFLVLFFIFNMKGMESLANGFLYTAVIVGLGSLISTALGNFIVKIWFLIAKVLGWINTRILLTILYYGFLFPIALISRMFKKDALKIQTKGRKSMFVERNHLYAKNDLKNIW